MVSASDPKGPIRTEPPTTRREFLVLSPAATPGKRYIWNARRTTSRYRNLSCHRPKAPLDVGSWISGQVANSHAQQLTTPTTPNLLSTLADPQSEPQKSTQHNIQHITWAKVATAGPLPLPLLPSRHIHRSSTHIKRKGRLACLRRLH